MKRFALVAFLVIFFLGAFLRFYRLKDLGTFRGDQAIELSTTAKILKGKFTLIGIKTSISQVHNGAVMYYIMAPFLYLFKFDPIAGGVVQSLLSLFTIPVVYYLGRKTGSQISGYLAAFFIAASPLLVRYSRQTLLAFYPLFFTSLSFLLIYLIYKKFSQKVSFLLGLLLGFMLQIHYSTVTVLVFMVIAPWLFLSKKLIKKYYLFLSVGFMVGLLPLLVFELRHQFFNTKMFLLFFFQQKNLAADNFNLFSYWFQVIAQLLFGGNLYIAVGFIVGILLLLLSFWRKLGTLEKLYILQIILVILFSLLFVRQMVTHYAIASFVPLILLTTALLHKLKNIFRGWFSKVAIIIATIFLLINFPSYGFFENHGWTMKEGWSLSGVEKTAQTIFSDILSSSFRTKYNVAMLVDSENQGLPLRYFLDLWGYPPLPVESYDKAKVLYVVAEPGLDLKKIDMWEIDSFGPYDIEKNWPIQNGFTLYRLGKRSL